MSTRATIHFHDKGSDEPEAIVYRHNDGYPEGLGLDLRRFIAEVRANVKDSRFTDPSYLSAKWIVFDAAQHRECSSKWNNGNPVHDLDFLSIGVCSKDPGDIEYRYHVICDGTPTVWGEEMECQSEGGPKAGKRIEIPELEPVTA